MAHEIDNLQLPGLLVGPADVSRLKREIEALDDFMQQQAIRKSGQAAGKLPRTSRILDELAQLNKLNLLQAADRERLMAFLRQLAADAPVIHISFAVDPSSAFTAKIVVWFRQNVHPQTLVNVGLQPSIAAGCVVRSTNHVYDFSLRRHFSDHRQLLIDKLTGKATA